jgi:hypothetical protein
LCPPAKRPDWFTTGASSARSRFNRRAMPRRLGQRNGTRFTSCGLGRGADKQARVCRPSGRGAPDLRRELALGVRLSLLLTSGGIVAFRKRFCHRSCHS